MRESLHQPTKPPPVRSGRSDARAGREASKAWDGAAPEVSQAYFRPLASPLYPKLEVGHANDPAERAADAFADRVVGGGGVLRRKEAGAGGGGGLLSAPPVVHQALAGAGHGLDAGARSTVEARGGVDLSGVRVHTDALAAESAAAVGAKAYTVGRDLVFGAGQYQPGTQEGLRLIAHEVGHLGSGVVRRDRSNGSDAKVETDDTDTWPMPLLDTVEAALEPGNIEKGPGKQFNAFWSGHTANAKTALTSPYIGPYGRAALVDNYQGWNSIGLSWSHVKYLRNVWNTPGQSRGMNVVWKDPSAVEAVLDSNKNMCVDTLDYDHTHISGKTGAPNKADNCWRQTSNGGPGLHICTGGDEDQTHVDPVQPAKGKDALGLCDFSAWHLVRHGISEYEHFCPKAEGKAKCLGGLAAVGISGVLTGGALPAIGGIAAFDLHALRSGGRAVRAYRRRGKSEP